VKKRKRDAYPREEKKSVTQVITESGLRIDVCSSCPESNLKERRWIKSEI
jgi:hypothetical protein